MPAKKSRAAARPTGGEPEAAPKSSGARRTDTLFGADEANAFIPRLGRSLPMQMVWTREAIMRPFRAVLRDNGLNDQTWRIVRILAEYETLEIYEIGQHCAILQASLSRIIPRLETEGIISRQTNATDQRRIIVSLTPQGRALFKKVFRQCDQIYAGMIARVGRDRIDVLHDLLEEVRSKLED